MALAESLREQIECSLVGMSFYVWDKERGAVTLASAGYLAHCSPAERPIGRKRNQASVGMMHE